MCNRVYKHLVENNLLFDIGLQVNNSTEHAILQLLLDFKSSFERKEYTLCIFTTYKNTLCVFIDFSNAFDAVDHDILLRKLKYYVIQNNT